MVDEMLLLLLLLDLIDSCPFPLAALPHPDATRHAMDTPRTHSTQALRFSGANAMTQIHDDQSTVVEKINACTAWCVLCVFLRCGWIGMARME